MSANNIKRKCSYGIICVRKKKKEPPSILMIKRPVTYHFSEFIRNLDKIDDKVFMKKLFDNMTFHEKMDIKNGDFSVLWYRIYCTKVENMPSNRWKKNYAYMENKYNYIINNKKNLLKEYIEKTSTVESTPWSLPKGRKMDKEKDLDAAEREFLEETGIPKESYKKILTLSPYVESYEDVGCIYITSYYFAESTDDWEPDLKLSNIVMGSEVSSIKWVTKNDIMHMCCDEQSRKRLTSMFEKIKLKYTNYLSKKPISVFTSNNEDKKSPSLTPSQPINVDVSSDTELSVSLSDSVDDEELDSKEPIKEKESRIKSFRSNKLTLNSPFKLINVSEKTSQSGIFMPPSNFSTPNSNINKDNRFSCLETFHKKRRSRSANMSML